MTTTPNPAGEAAHLETVSAAAGRLIEATRTAVP